MTLFGEVNWQNPKLTRVGGVRLDGTKLELWVSMGEGNPNFGELELGSVRFG